MKRILTVLALILVLSGSAFGLSDKEYLSMKRNDTNFAEAYTFATYDPVNELEEWEELMFGDEDN